MYIHIYIYIHVVIIVILSINTDWPPYGYDPGVCSYFVSVCRVANCCSHLDGFVTPVATLAQPWVPFASIAMPLDPLQRLSAALERFL